MTLPVWAGLLLATAIMWIVLLRRPLPRDNGGWSRDVAILYRVVVGIMLTLIAWLIYFMVT